jgi:AraC-like DNA-binding protein
MAEQAGMSSRHFARAFIAETGTTASKAAERLPIEVARQRLQFSREAIEQSHGRGARAAFRSITTETLAKMVDQREGHYKCSGCNLINAPTLGGWYLLQGPAVAISHTTGIHALLFSGLSRSEGERGEIGIARIECSRTQ